MKKILISIVILIAVIFLMAVTWVVFALTPEPWAKPDFSMGFRVTPDSAVCIDSGVPIGEPVTLKSNVTASIYYTAEPKLAIDLPEGLVMVGQPEIIAAPSFMPAGWEFQCAFTLAAYRPDSYPGLTPSLRLKGVEAIPDTTIMLPTLDTLYFVELQVDADSVPQIAGILPIDEEFTSPSRWIWIIPIATALFMFLVLIWTLMRKRQEVKAVVFPWDEANQRLDRLSTLLKTHDISSEVAAAQLTDIVRHYLTARFGLPASSTTTQEFFALLARPGSPLVDDHKAFLNQFLAAADLIKFAGVSADDQMLLHAIHQARQLVAETLIREEVA